MNWMDRFDCFFRKMASYYPNVRRQKSTGDDIGDRDRKNHLRDKTRHEHPVGKPQMFMTAHGESSMNVFEEFKQVVLKLEEQSVRYALVGGIARMQAGAIRAAKPCFFMAATPPSVRRRETLGSAQSLQFANEN